MILKYSIHLTHLTLLARFTTEKAPPPPSEASTGSLHAVVEMRLATPTTVAGALLLLAGQAAAGFSLPGVQMTTYKKGEHLPLFVNSLTSSETLLPLDYYKLPFCQVRSCVLVCESERMSA